VFSWPPFAAHIALNRPLFLYYPLHGDLIWGQPLTGIGPAMAWYGLMADAIIIATVLAVCHSRSCPAACVSKSTLAVSTRGYAGVRRLAAAVFSREF
jgi:hypothetical protein